MAIRLSRSVRDAIIADARAVPEQEVCGLLTGGPDCITGHIVAPNVASDPRTRFEIDPAVLIAAHRAARLGRGPQVIGCYHSHPRGNAVPSRQDRADAAADGQLWLIVGQDGGTALWRATQRTGADGTIMEAVPWHFDDERNGAGGSARGLHRGGKGVMTRCTLS